MYLAPGHTADLILFALKTLLRASKIIRGMGVVTHPLGDNVRRFCAQWRFGDLPPDPQRAMMMRMSGVERYLAE